MDDTEQNPAISPPQVIEKPTSITVFGVLNIVVGCYPFIRTYPVFYKIIAPALRYGLGKITVAEMSFLLFSFFVGISLSIWLIVLGIGLLRMKKWARRGSIIYAWISIGLFTFNLSYTIVMILLGSIKLPVGSWSFWGVYIHAALIGLIYPILLLIFMQTVKIKQAFSAIER